MTPSECQFPVVTIGGLPTAAVTRSELADLMVQDCLAARQQGNTWVPKAVFSSNGQGIALAGRSAEFAEVMQDADIIHADGMPAVFASRITKTQLPERIATTDFFHDAARAAQENGLRFYMLGATASQNAKAVAEISRIYPQLQVVGSRDGYFDSANDEQVCEEIMRCQPDVLWVALGKPRQEYWSIRNKSRLGGVGWIKTCGGLYAFLAGDAPRAPEWMQSLGLEWLYRALKEPRRLGWRYLVTNPYSLYRLLRYTK